LRKIILLVMVLIFSLLLSSAAFAAQTGDFVFRGNSQISAVTNGCQGYSWNHPDADGGKLINLKELSKYYFSRLHKDKKQQRNWDKTREIELYYYIDDNGVRHYFYLDPDRDYKVHKYKDNNGLTQYSFKDIGWK
jgi:hypothetical protein